MLMALMPNMCDPMACISGDAYAEVRIVSHGYGLPIKTFF
jgi:hypothetical protein